MKATERVDEGMFGTQHEQKFTVPIAKNMTSENFDLESEISRITCASLEQLFNQFDINRRSTTKQEMICMIAENLRTGFVWVSETKDDSTDKRFKFQEILRKEKVNECVSRALYLLSKRKFNNPEDARSYLANVLLENLM